MSERVESAALRFVAACCRWPSDNQRRAFVENCASEIEDWSLVTDLARGHRVEGLVSDAVRRFQLAAPDAIGGWALEMRDMMRAQALLEIGETLRVCGALDGINYKVLKGVPLGIRAYGRAGMKRSWDIDILVDDTDAVEAARRIADLDYFPVKPPRLLDQGELRRWSSVSKHASLGSPRGIEVELHWRLTSLPGMLPDISARMPGRPVELIGGRGVPTLSDDASLAYLCVHGTSHGWSRLKWLADFSALVSGWSEGELQWNVEAAERHGTGESVPVAFLLRERLLDFPLPGFIEVTDRAREIADLCVSIVAAREAEAAIEDNRAAAAAIEQVRRLMGRGRGYVSAYLRQRHRGTEIRALVALPLWLDWAYWLIRPYSYLHRAIRRRRR